MKNLIQYISKSVTTALIALILIVSTNFNVEKSNRGEQLQLKKASIKKTSLSIPKKASQGVR